MELLEKLKKLKQDDPYPMHMPGHKRIGLDFPDVYDIDNTEIDGFDNLHQPSGIIKMLADEVAGLYGSDEAYLSVGGSTDMILTSVFAATKPGDKVLIARNCHKSVYHAAALRDLRAEYLYPEILELGIPGGIRPEQVSEAFSRHDGIRCCVVTSPTYEGVISDIEKISDICHQNGASLIVDAAHGAHLGFGDFPENPIKQGADAVIVSLHKTLPSLTQTACLLRNSDSLISAERIKKYFDYFETSSPSYVLMAGIDRCVTFLKEKGDEAFSEYGRKLSQLREQIRKIPQITLFEPETYSYDPSKLVLSLDGRSGSELADILRRGKIEPEMSSLDYCLAMTSVMDTDEGFERLYEVLKNSTPGENSKKNAAGLYSITPEKRYDIGIAEKSEIFFKERNELIGEVSGATVTVYPPGIPLIVPGEVFTEEVSESLEAAETSGLTIDGDSDGKYTVIKEN